MFEENKITLKNGKEVTIKPREGDRLAGDVMIDYGTYKKPGIFLGGGLSGRVVVPEAINKPFELPKEEGISEKLPIDQLGNDGRLTGSIIAPIHADDVLISLLDIKKIIDNIIKNHPDVEDVGLLNDLYRELVEKYYFNRDYMDDLNISNIDKVNDVKGVVNNNLEDIRNAVLDLQEELDKEDSKGL